MLGPKEDVEGMLWKKFWCRFVAKMRIENLRIEFGKLKFSRSSAGHECKTIGKRSLRFSGNWIQMIQTSIDDILARQSLMARIQSCPSVKSHL